MHAPSDAPAACSHSLPHYTNLLRASFALITQKIRICLPPSQHSINSFLWIIFLFFSFLFALNRTHFDLLFKLLPNILFLWKYGLALECCAVLHQPFHKLLLRVTSKMRDRLSLLFLPPLVVIHHSFFLSLTLSLSLSLSLSIYLSLSLSIYIYMGFWNELSLRLSMPLVV